jgi:hypothetical protein
MSKLAAADFAEQMLHMPGVVHSSPPFPADTFQMAKTDDDFHNRHRVLLRAAISENIGARILARSVSYHDGNPIMSRINVYEPKERLLTTQREDGKIVCCMFIWGS